MSSAREEILDKLKKASKQMPLPEEPDYRIPLFPEAKGPLSEIFKNANEQINGLTHVFESEKKLFEGLKELFDKKGWTEISCFESSIQEKLSKTGINFNTDIPLPENIEAGITGCEFLIAQTGSALVSSAQKGARQIFVYPPVHIIIASESQLSYSLDEAYQKLSEKYNSGFPSMVSLISGPSRTADIEKTLVLGAHGPKELHIFISK